jgi:hypothetical protein
MSRRAAFLALLFGCSARIEDGALRDREGGVARLQVDALGDRGQPDAPLAYASTGVEFTLRVEAFDRNNQRAAGFNGFVALSMEPGLVLAVTTPGALGAYVPLTNGLAEGVRVRVARGYGAARIWAEETGYAPVDPQRVPAPSCANGRDDDGDGFVDYPADHGCAAANDDTERGGSYAAGTSEPIYFDTPNLADVQGQAAVSPLLDERVTVRGWGSPQPPPMGSRRHRLVVTQTDNSGFFVTDIDDASCDGAPCFNSMYSFNFRAPDGMRPCDLLLTLTGSVAEFVSTTQLAQPGYQIAVAWRPDDPATGACQIPDPVLLTPELVRDTARMERYESSLVRAMDVTLPTVIGPLRPGDGTPRAGQTNCDFSGDGSVDFGDPAEAACANACDADPQCSEWNAWARFGQVRVTLAGGGGRVAAALRTVDPNYDPQNPPAATATLTGMLRQVGPNWIIGPRCDQDFAVTTRPVRPVRESCLHERSLSEE